MGDIIWIRESVLTNFETPEHVVVERGFVNYVVLRPKAVVDVRYPVFTEAVTLMNIYLHSNAGLDKEKKALLERMTALDLPTDFVYAAGDTNIKDTPDDVASGKVSAESVRDALQNFLAKHRL